MGDQFATIFFGRIANGKDHYHVMIVAHPDVDIRTKRKSLVDAVEFVENWKRENPGYQVRDSELGGAWKRRNYLSKQGD